MPTASAVMALRFQARSKNLAPLAVPPLDSDGEIFAHGFPVFQPAEDGGSTFLDVNLTGRG
eukprot:2101453-Pyramimonas_sp.AAC.1